MHSKLGEAFKQALLDGDLVRNRPVALCIQLQTITISEYATSAGFVVNIVNDRDEVLMQIAQSELKLGCTLQIFDLHKTFNIKVS